MIISRELLDLYINTEVEPQATWSYHLPNQVLLNEDVSVSETQPVGDQALVIFTSKIWCLCNCVQLWRLCGRLIHTWHFTSWGETQLLLGDRFKGPKCRIQLIGANLKRLNLKIEGLYCHIHSKNSCYTMSCNSSCYVIPITCAVQCEKSKTTGRVLGYCSGA